MVDSPRNRRKYPSWQSTISAGEFHTTCKARRHRSAAPLQSIRPFPTLGRTAMPTSNRGARAAQSLLLAGLFAVVAAPAMAGECPADKLGANPLANAPTAPAGVTENELSSIDLAKENV